MTVKIISNILEIFILVLIFQSDIINSLNINEKYPSTFLLSNGDLFLVTENGLRIYDSTFTTLQQYYNFDSQHRITSEDEAEKTAIAEYPDGTVIALVNNNLYILNSERSYIKKKDLSSYLTNGKYYNLIAYNHGSLYYYFVIAYYDNGNITLKYFYFSTGIIITLNSPIYTLSYKPTNSQGVQTGLRNYGLSCGVMIYNENDVITCFYQLNSPDELGVSSYYITTTRFQEVDVQKIFSPNNQASIIKSVMSPDKKKALICYNKDYTFSKCLQYDIVTNQFTSEELYFDTCKGKSIGLYVYYFQQKNEYMFICSNNAVGFNAVVFDSDFQATILNSGEGKTEPYYNYGSNCYFVYNFNVVYLSSTDKYILINDCDTGHGIKTGSINLEELSGESNSFPEDENVDTFDNNELIVDNVNDEFNTDSTFEKTKEEIINNLNDIIKDKDPSQTYIIRGNDYTVIIKQVDEYIEESTVNIDFSECLKVLKAKYPTKEFRILQVIFENKKEKCLTDQVEYKIYDQLGNEIDLSICSNINIKIEYEIRDTSSLDIEQISNFREKGIDVFNINDVFFNDICFAYSDHNSSSDMVLTDRVSDIYQNYSLCEKGCEYDSVNIEKMSVYCNCKVKQEVNYKEEEGFLETYISNTFYSNFGVAKCYNLVFSFNGKLNNSGFWIFAIIIILHIPIYILYFINGINPVLKYIIKAMAAKGYNIKMMLNNQKSVSTPRSETNQLNTDPTQDLMSKKDRKRIKNNPPKNYIQKKSSLKKKNNMFNFNSNKDNKKVIFANEQNQKPEVVLISSRSDDENNSIDEDDKYKYKEKKKEFINNSEKVTKRNIKSHLELNKKKLKMLPLEKLKNLEVIETKTTVENIQKYRKNKDIDNITVLTEDRKEKTGKSKKKYSKLNKNNKKKNSIIVGLESGELLTIKKGERKNLKKKNAKFKNNSTNSIPTIGDEQENNNKKSNKEDKTLFPLILIDANNTRNYEPIQSNYVLTNYDYNEAINYDKRSFCRIFYIFFISKENNFNIIIFKSPLESRPLRICIFIFNYSCDIALNALFYLSDNISDSYHYTGENKLLYSLMNNLTISFFSAIFSYILLFFFNSLIQSNNNIEYIFRKQEKLLKSDRNYRVNEQTKREIINNIYKIVKYLKVKIKIYLIMELLFTLFFLYYVTAFCQVYQSTQISWLLDCLLSYVISLFFVSFFSFICSLLYKISIKCKKEVIYKIITYIYSSM